MTYESIRDLVYKVESLEREIEDAKAGIGYDTVTKEIERIHSMEAELEEAKSIVSPAGKKAARRPAKKQAAKNAVQNAVAGWLMANVGLHTSGDVMSGLGPNFSASSVKAALRRLANGKEINRKGKLGYYYGELPNPQPELAGPEPEA